jgi:hypothetical protein
MAEDAESAKREMRERKMQAITQALADYRDGVRVSATCPVCGSSLRVTVDERIGSTWVICESGCTSAHFKWQPKAAAD